MDALQATADYHKFCPGEESVKISNAICRGRRRSHHPSCNGCKFNDDEKGRDQTQTADKTDDVSPVESLFRSNEIRGTVPSPLSHDAAWRIGHATAQYLRGRLRGYDRADPNARNIIVGRDTRSHSEDLQDALVEGIRSSSLDVIDIGPVDTPQLYFAVNNTNACGGIQVTAGDMPPDHNGFLICGAKAAPVTTETGLVSIRDIATRVPRHNTGSQSRLSEKDFSAAYAEFVRPFLHRRSHRAERVTVVCDAANGTAGASLSAIFKGARKLTVVPMGFEHDGRFNHVPNPFDPKNTRELRKLTKQHKADIAVSFNGDATSCIFLDDRGLTVRSDLIATLLARMFIERSPGAAVVLDVRSTRAAVEEIERAGGVAILTRVGPSFVKKAMAERNAVFGADLHGRFYFRDNFYCESAILALVHVLNLITDTDHRLSELVRSVSRYRSTGELRFHRPDPDHALREIRAAHADAHIDMLDGITVTYPDWSFNVRPAEAGSYLYAMVEARTRKTADEYLARLEPLLGERA